MNGAEYAQLKREAYRDQTTNEYLPDEQVFTVAQELEYVREGVSTDYRDLMMSNGFNQNYELSITGGTEKTQHSISLGYRGERFRSSSAKAAQSRLPILQNLYRISKRKASAWSDTKALPMSVIPMTEFPVSDTENSF